MPWWGAFLLLIGIYGLLASLAWLVVDSIKNAPTIEKQERQQIAEDYVAEQEANLRWEYEQAHKWDGWL